MKIPAIRGKIGSTIYYIANLQFDVLSQFVNRLNSEEVYNSKSLKEALQRSLTDNVSKIKEYILSHDDRFFNALVLAVYDGNPRWKEVDFEIDDVEYSNLGILDFSGDEKIFPVDGQHRLEGIKQAIKQNNELCKETVPVILIGHTTNDDGMQKTRRIFSVLNRYAKPVRKGDIIALDEDDIVAIVTRNLLETHPLFMGNHIKIGNTKSISSSDKSSFTNLMTLYDCIDELFCVFYFLKHHEEITSSKLVDYKRNRPNDEIVTCFTGFCVEFWSLLCDSFQELNSYKNDYSNNSAASMRPQREGGHLLFRPVGLLPFISAICEIRKRKQDQNFRTIMSFFSQRDIFDVAATYWERILWNPLTNKMIMHNNDLVYLLILNMYDSSLLLEKERLKMIEKYSTIFNIERESVMDRINSHFGF